MIELRWVRRPERRYEAGNPRAVTYYQKVLQYRTARRVERRLSSALVWEDWIDVPEVEDE